MEETKRLEAEIEKLKAQDVKWQDEIFPVRRQLNSTEANANQLTSRVAVLETEVVRAIEDLSRENARREVADDRLSALRTCWARAVWRPTPSSVFARCPSAFERSRGRSL
jgi:chromosome segregation ATPase